LYDAWGNAVAEFQAHFKVGEVVTGGGTCSTAESVTISANNTTQSFTDTTKVYAVTIATGVDNTTLTFDNGCGNTATINSITSDETNITVTSGTLGLNLPALSASYTVTGSTDYDLACGDHDVHVTGTHTPSYGSYSCATVCTSGGGTWSSPTCTCPVGTTWDGTTCACPVSGEIYYAGACDIRCGHINNNGAMYTKSGEHITTRGSSYATDPSWRSDYNTAPAWKPIVTWTAATTTYYKLQTWQTSDGTTPCAVLTTSRTTGDPGVAHSGVDEADAGNSFFTPGDPGINYYGLCWIIPSSSTHRFQVTGGGVYNHYTGGCW
jgi:hypothetical protein